MSAERQREAVQLYTENQRLGVAIAHRFMRWQGLNYLIDDIEREGLIALWRAACTYDPQKLVAGKPVRFSTWAYHVVMSYLLRQAPSMRVPFRVSQKCRNVPTVVRLDLATESSGVWDLLVDSDPDPATTAECKENVDELRFAMAHLSAKDRYVVEARYGIGRDKKTLRELGEELGVTKESIRLVELRAMRQLRELLKGDTP